jgi:hypothetical protein
MQIGDDRTAAQVEEILGQSAVTSALPSSVAEMGQCMLYPHSLPQLRPAQRGVLAGGQLRQKRLVQMDVHATAVGTARTLRAQGTDRTSGGGGA